MWELSEEEAQAKIEARQEVHEQIRQTSEIG